MTEKERLVELMISAKRDDPEDGSSTEFLADYLLAKGVSAPPVKIGDKVWLACTEDDTVEELEVLRITIGENATTITFTDETCFTVWDKDYSVYYENVFLTREEAEKSLAERSEE